MKTLNVFARYFAVLAMLFLVQNSLVAQIEPCQPDDCTLEPGYITTGTQTICSYDPMNDTYCCVAVDYTLKRYSCPFPIPPKWRFYIDKIEVLGSCNGGQSEITESAIKAIIAASVGPNNLQNVSVSIPSCIEKTSLNPEIWEACDIGCCIADFVARWDTTTGDYHLNSISLDSSGVQPCGMTDGCELNCTIDNMPDEGRLHISDKLPPACLTSCIPDMDIPYSWAYINSGGDELSGLYAVGKEADNTPCFSFHYFWDLNGTKTRAETVEALVKKALKDIWLNGNPQYISLNLPKCIGQPFPGRKMYVNCTYDVGCCRIKFEIINNGATAKVVAVTPAPGVCSFSCTEICSLFSLNSEYGIPKLAVLGELEETNHNVKIIPNPTNGIFGLEFDTAVAGTHLIKVVDLRGFEVYTFDVNAIKGMNTLNLDLTNIPLGVYYLQVLIDGVMISNVKFIRN